MPGVKQRVATEKQNYINIYYTIQIRYTVKKNNCDDACCGCGMTCILGNHYIELNCGA